jgi:hypothetical protein
MIKNHSERNESEGKSFETVSPCITSPLSTNLTTFKVTPSDEIKETYKIIQLLIFSKDYLT